MSNAKTTGKRRVSVDIGGLDVRSPTLPLVPDLTATQKALIHDELLKCHVLTQGRSRQGVSSPPEYASVMLGDIQPTTETRYHKLARKVKGLFVNDQRRIPSRGYSLGDSKSSRRDNDDDSDLPSDEMLYNFDGRSKNTWRRSGF